MLWNYSNDFANYTIFISVYINLREEFKMKKVLLKEKVKNVAMKVKLGFYRTMNEERGDIGIKQIAITVGIIVIIGLAVAAISGLLPDMVQTVFDYFMGRLDDITM